MIIQYIQYQLSTFLFVWCPNDNLVREHGESLEKLVILRDQVVDHGRHDRCPHAHEEVAEGRG